MHIFMRLAPILMTLPIFFINRTPIIFRLVLTFVLSILLFNSQKLIFISSSIDGLIGEFMLGLLIVINFHLIYGALDQIGKMIELQMGVNSAAVFDPSTSHETGVISDFMIFVTSVVFFLLDYHYALLKGFVVLLDFYPLGSFDIDVLYSSFVFGLFTKVFLLVFILMSPVIVVLWMIDICFAFMSRSMPQANIYFLALPVKILIGAFVIFLTIPIIVSHTSKIYQPTFEFPHLTYRLKKVDNHE
jgi:flagellar biosynthetic protein FliR